MANDYTPEFVAFLIDQVYEKGYSDGVAWADETMGASLRLAFDPPEHLNPGAKVRTAGTVVDSYLKWLENQTKKPIDPPPVRLDYQGGPVVWSDEPGRPSLRLIHGGRAAS